MTLGPRPPHEALVTLAVSALLAAPCAGRGGPPAVALVYGRGGWRVQCLGCGRAVRFAGGIGHDGADLQERARWVI